MKNSVETIILDIKKLFKELELAYGEVKPHICDIENVEEKCPNTKCWVQRVRDDQFDRICELERIILEAINRLTKIQKIYGKGDLEDELRFSIKMLERSINPTPCEDCLNDSSCKSANRLDTMHGDPCPRFENKKNQKIDTTPNIAVQF